jgi:hypothetical protein
VRHKKIVREENFETVRAKQQDVTAMKKTQRKGNDAQEFRGGSRRGVLTVVSHLILRRGQESAVRREG